VTGFETDFDMKTLKLILLIALIFVAGFAAGVVTTRLVVRHIIQRALAQPDFAREYLERGLDRRLGLDAEQQRQAHEILLDAHTQIKALRQQFQPEFCGIVTNTQMKISAILTPEQQELFERFRAEHREIFQSR
jgi:hypothetical protein